MAQADSTEDSIENVASAIYTERKDLKTDAENYETQISLNKSTHFTSATLIRVFESILDRFTNPLFSTLVGNIVANVVKNKTTPLQLAMGILLHHSKTTIRHLYDYRVTLSNDEVQRFKKSAAAHSAKSNPLHGVS